MVTGLGDDERQTNVEEFEGADGKGLCFLKSVDLEGIAIVEVIEMD